MTTKWRVVLETAHGYKQIDCLDEAQAKDVYDNIKAALKNGCIFIDIDDTLISTTALEMVRIDKVEQPKMLTDEQPMYPPYESVRHIDIPPARLTDPSYTPTYTYGGPSWNPKVVSGTVAIDLDTSNKGTEPEKKDEGRTYVAEPDRFETLANTINEFRIDTFQGKKRGKR